MSMGKVISVAKKIPSSCPFRDYEQLRRHWKNMVQFILRFDLDLLNFLYS